MEDKIAFVKVAFDNAFGALRDSGLTRREQSELLIKIFDERRQVDDEVLWEAIDSFDSGSISYDHNYNGSDC